MEQQLSACDYNKIATVIDQHGIESVPVSQIDALVRHGKTVAASPVIISVFGDAREPLVARERAFSRIPAPAVTPRQNIANHLVTA